MQIVDHQQNPAGGLRVGRTYDCSRNLKQLEWIRIERAILRAFASKLKQNAI
jgi:hypothetical protein